MEAQARRVLLITGGAGFIGSHVVRHFVTHYPEYRVINLDKLTYAGNLANLRDVEAAPNYSFVRGDIGDAELVRSLFREQQIDGVIHLAAESHVDRSIRSPLVFAQTNVLGTLCLLQAAAEAWLGEHPVPRARFLHISTDEVYGALLPGEPAFCESTPYAPHSPYSASKAAADHFVRAWHDTYGLPVVITNCSNNYGPCQFPEKLIPLCIRNICAGRPLPIYGRGENVRDWLHVADHARAIDAVFHHGRVGESYNIGGRAEWSNIELVRLLIRLVDARLGRPAGASCGLITYVADRAGHDFRYAIDSHKIRSRLGWAPQIPFEQGLSDTVDWYLEHEDWVRAVTSGAYERYYAEMYGSRNA